MTKRKQEDFFVGLSNTHDIRLGILESTKLSLESMKVFQELKEVRKKKLHEKDVLRKQLRVISSTINKIKATLPHINLPAEKPAPKPIKLKPVKKVKLPPPKPKTEMDRIEDQLADIERKIASIH